MKKNVTIKSEYTISFLKNADIKHRSFYNIAHDYNMEVELIPSMEIRPIHHIDNISLLNYKNDQNDAIQSFYYHDSKYYIKVDGKDGLSLSHHVFTNYNSNLYNDRIAFKSQLDNTQKIYDNLDHLIKEEKINKIKKEKILLDDTIIILNEISKEYITDGESIYMEVEEPVIRVRYEYDYHTQKYQYNVDLTSINIHADKHRIINDYTDDDNLTSLGTIHHETIYLNLSDHKILDKLQKKCDINPSFKIHNIEEWGISHHSTIKNLPTILKKIFVPESEWNSRKISFDLLSYENAKLIIDLIKELQNTYVMTESIDKKTGQIMEKIHEIRHAIIEDDDRQDEFIYIAKVLYDEWKERKPSLNEWMEDSFKINPLRDEKLVAHEIYDMVSLKEINTQLNLFISPEKDQRIISVYDKTNLSSGKVQGVFIMDETGKVIEEYYRNPNSQEKQKMATLAEQYHYIGRDKLNQMNKVKQLSISL